MTKCRLPLCSDCVASFISAQVSECGHSMGSLYESQRVQWKWGGWRDETWVALGLWLAWQLFLELKHPCNSLPSAVVQIWNGGGGGGCGGPAVALNWNKDKYFHQVWKKKPQKESMRTFLEVSLSSSILLEFAECGTESGLWLRYGWV